MIFLVDTGQSVVQENQVSFSHLDRNRTFARGSLLHGYEHLWQYLFQAFRIYLLVQEFFASNTSKPKTLRILPYAISSVASILAVFKINIKWFTSSRELPGRSAPKGSGRRTYSFNCSRILVERTVPEPSSLDAFRNFLQTCTNRPIIWWPLTEPKTPLPTGSVRLSWFCSGCEDITVDVAEAVADCFERKLQENEHVSESEANPGSSGLSLDHEGSPDDSTTNMNGGGSNEPCPLRGGKRARRRYPFTSIDSKAASQNPPIDTAKYVHWCVDSARTQVHNVCVEAAVGAKTGSQFIQELLSSYRRLRGLRWWFSLTDCANVKLVKFVRLFENEAIVACRPDRVTVRDIRLSGEYEIETGGASDDDLHISWAEGALTHYLRYDCENKDEEIDVLISGLPRRKDRTSGKLVKSMGYGIRAQHGWSLFKFLVLLSLSTLGGLVFFVYWLILHPGDLQNASIPYFMILAAVGSFVAIPDYIS
ncbi:hypothetical protein K432DRAFT_430344 [Lepidopterella palustris CBS 459.81]|uniref:Uncharacterized protein n=1 Tax=Lepidopterella palustris CBS 459.81 TaxID=1314670 RepID=A0A8E2J954_9PEZI|nr:hypothetical protein K432DRAFT_430344 [Lepidopterella palustris CBS 459.81]